MKTVKFKATFDCEITFEENGDERLPDTAAKYIVTNELRLRMECENHIEIGNISSFEHKLLPDIKIEEIK